MDRLCFDDYIDMAEYMYDTSLDDGYIVAVLFYDDAVELLRELLSFENVEIAAIDIEPPYYNGYDREYFVSLDEYQTLSVEPAYVGDRYLNTDADELLLDGNAHCNAIADTPLDRCYEILVEDDPCCDDCDCDASGQSSICEFTITLGELFDHLINGLSF